MNPAQYRLPDEIVARIRRRALLWHHPIKEEPFTRVTVADGSTCLIVRIDKADDDIFELQRSSELMSLAGKCLASSPLPLKTDCIYLGHTLSDMYLQQQVGFAGHFEDERAVCLIMAVGNADRSLSVIPNPQQVLFQPVNIADNVLVRLDFPFPDRRAISGAPGDLSVMNPWDVLCTSSSMAAESQPVLVFSYRSSRYLDALESNSQG